MSPFLNVKYLFFLFFFHSHSVLKFRKLDYYYLLELDHNGINRKTRIWICVDRKHKISILILSSALILNLSKILESLCYPEIVLSFLI